MRIGRLLPRLHELLNVPCTLLVERLADGGQRQFPRRAQNQAAFQLAFELLNVATDRVRRHPETPRGFGKASGLDDLDEEIDFVQVKHTFLTNLDGFPPSRRSSGQAEGNLR